ncbi:MAG: hypothetical protein K2X27_05875, partial [Candidatus Obscuribacterales bacterium]|nr:hypothetical protein [Candidatus Obscuribacterales bacterium]
REQGGREMFNEREDSCDPAEMREAIKELGGSRVIVHKLTLAPEINPADKKAFTRDVMINLSQEMGRDLEWFAVKHDNTEHHHIHVVVLGRDRHGTEVKIDLKDIDKVKEFGDRFLERHHPRELERSRGDRERREKERLEARKQERELEKAERIREGLELPWMNRKMVREQLEPYKEWKEKQELDREERRKEKERGEKEREEKPYHQDTIEAAGRQWSKADSLAELRELNRHLWDSYEDRIGKDEYKKLVGWIKDKEKYGDREPEKKQEREEKERDYFEHKGEKYSKDDSYEKLTGLSAKLRESKEKLPIEDYQNLRGWIENKDRQRWSGAIEKQVEIEKAKFARDEKSYAAGQRAIDPLQQDLMRNPVIGLFMVEASIASELVRSIPLDDRNRDYLKEQRQDLEKAKGGIEEKSRDWDEFDKMTGLGPEKKRDRNKELEQKEKIDKAIEETKKAKEKEQEEKKRKEQERDRDDPFKRDPWGRW